MTHSANDMIKLMNRNSAALVIDKTYGMCSSTRIAHKKADRPDMDTRAIQYALAMMGQEVPHSSDYFGGVSVRHKRIDVAGYKTPQKRAVSVAGKGLDEQFNIPHWDYVELGILST
jgi:hypothetical protein